MASLLGVDDTPWEQTLAQFARQAKYDDIAAMVAAALASIAYLTKGTLWAKPDPHRYKLFERPQQKFGVMAAPKQSTDIVERLEQNKADIALLWASQSGTAERLAGRLAKELTRLFGANVLLLDISDIKPDSCARVPPSKFTIFIASTFGEGDPSDNMHEFWSWLHQANGPSLDNMRYLAFGLGNSKYKHYNNVIDVLCERLQAGGAHSLMPTGKADDAAGETEEHFLEWKGRVFEMIETKLGYQRQEASYEPSIQIVADDSLQPIDLHHGEPQMTASAKTATSHSKVYTLPVVECRELFNNPVDRNCIHIELDLSERPDLKYKTGDHLGVWPVNPSQDLERLIRVLGLDTQRGTPYHIKPLEDGAAKIPSPTTLNALFEHYLEICAPVSREHVATLAGFAPSSAANENLVTISHDKAAYAEHLANNHVNLGRLLEDTCSEPGGWKQLPLSLVIEILPAMQPRYYSISSSSVVQARKAAITAVVADTTLATTGERIPGLATNYLLAIKDGSHPRGLSYSLPVTHQPLHAVQLHAHVRKSTFKLPAAASTPILMVGAGTGVAPFRAFVHERARLKTMGREVGPTKLFFRCRNPEQDSIYKDEFDTLSNTLGSCFSLTTAFSRPTNGDDRRYVQDRIIEEAEAVCKLLIEQNAYFYVCGSAAMARDVTEAVGVIAQASQGWNEAQMKEFTDRQKRQRRWVQDVWG